jgi:hypothetical protein
MDFNNSKIHAMKPYTFAFLLLRVPLESFFIRSSYEKLYSQYVSQIAYWKGEEISKEEKDIYDKYFNTVNSIVRLCPNINIPTTVYDVNGQEDII